jgi:GT2 family glycosyltransferase
MSDGLMKKINVSIINYKTAELTIQCLRSVVDDMEGINGHISVVDNSSNDGSAEKIGEWIKTDKSRVPITLVCSETNSGFSGGHNMGISTCPAEFYLVLNSDAVLRSGFFKAILATATANPNTGLFAPRLEDEDGTPQISCFRFHSPASELIRGAATGFITSLLSRYNVPLCITPEPDKIEWASFACILLRHEMFEAIGPMDDGYFLYFEDSEYCLRAYRAGWPIIFVPDARAVHYRGGSAPVKALAKQNKRLPAYYYASRTRFFYQAYGWLGLVLANLLWVTGRLFANLRRFVGKSVPMAKQNERHDIWRNTFDPLGSRKMPRDL